MPRNRANFGIGTLVAGFRPCAVAERALHQHGIEPASELVSDILDRPDHLKAAGAVKLDRRRLAGIADHRDHLAEVALLRFHDQAIEQDAADAEALRLR